MSRFFFDLAHSGDVYHDAHGTDLASIHEVSDRAFEIVRRLVIGAKSRDVVCTVRDINGKELMQVRIEWTAERPEGPGKSR
ncbi:DUF6894 family protein [Mesorhizobium argentiipisi]|uniref:DUF6894 domain-containing protein n=1 Tax=Mesorhizobium argentiipisi TaxID=3015175 RepID=A0ABU8KLY0_9HYPH